ncbi:MAG: IS66 family transposase [Lentisphaeria bacterium]
MSNCECKTVENLKAEVSQLRIEKQQLENEKNQLAAEKAMLQELLNLEQARKFSPKSERSNPNQLELPFEMTELQDAVKEEVAITHVPEHTRSKKTHPNLNGRVEIPESLPREEIYLDIPEAEKVDKTGAPLQLIGEDITEQLAIKPTEVFVKRYHRPKYASSNRRSGEGVKSPELPAHPLNRCKADVSMITWLLVNKYINYLPLYRQRKMLQSYGIDIAESTLNNWANHTAEVLQELWSELKKEIFKQDFINADDTPVDVLFPTDKSKASRKKRHIAEGRLWCYRATSAKLVWFDFSQNWTNKSPLERLDKFTGYVQSDGYSGYRNAAARSGFTPVGCWAHVRRKFIEANVTPNKIAQKYILWINILYRIEHKIAELSSCGNYPSGELLELRKKRAERVMKKLFKSAKQEQLLPKTPLGRALTYVINQEKCLKNYVLDLRITPDNNAAERAIRPVTIARKNFLFVGSPDAGMNTAVIFSLAESCRANGVDFGEYLNTILPKLSKNLSGRELQDLLPHNFSK